MHFLCFKKSIKTCVCLNGIVLFATGVFACGDINARPGLADGNTTLAASARFTWDGNRQVEYKLANKTDVYFPGLDSDMKGVGFSMQASGVIVSNFQYLVHTDMWVDGVSHTNEYSSSLFFDINARSFLKRCGQGMDTSFLAHAQTNRAETSFSMVWNGKHRLDSFTQLFSGGRVLFLIGNDKPRYVTKIKVRSSEKIVWENKPRKDDYLYGDLSIELEHEPVLFILEDRLEVRNARGGDISGSGRTRIAVVSVRVPIKNE